MRNVFFHEILNAFECQKAIKNVQCSFIFPFIGLINASLASVSKEEDVAWLFFLFF